jgi:hypothetical protein
MSEVRLLTMLTGWVMTWSGVRRRSWPGTVLAMTGLALANGAMIFGRPVSSQCE